MKMNKLLWILAIPLSIVLFGLFIYPGLYHFDKLNQRLPVKINRLTGDAYIFGSDGWTEFKHSELENETSPTPTPFVYTPQPGDEELGFFERRSKELGLIPANAENEQDQNEEDTGVDSYFSLGSSEDEVKSVMGTPTKIRSSALTGNSTWSYGLSYIVFVDGVVTEYYNVESNLKIK